MIDDLVITRLDLSLCCCAGYGKSREDDTRQRHRERNKRMDDDGRLPCLTLGLPDSSSAPVGPIDRTNGSESSLKAEEEEEGSPRKKLRLSKRQTSVMEEYFNANTTLHGLQKQGLANQLNLRPRQVEVWFQNRRARTKLKQTEVDCELLRKCCETLKEDNARLKMELQRLRSKNLNDTEEPSTSTASVCPSCETSFPSTE